MKSPRTLAKIKNRELISHGALTAESSDAIEIFPFDESPEYKVVFKHGLKSDGETDTDVTVNDDGNIVIEVRYVSHIGVKTLNTHGIIFAVDEQNEYHFGYLFETIGSSSKFAVFLTYSIYREAING